MLHIDGNFTYNKKKPCKYCRNFFMWGIGEGYCIQNNQDMMCYEHCKYYNGLAESPRLLSVG